MRRLIILISLILAIGLAFMYKYMVLDPPPPDFTLTREYGDVFQNIQFNNGYNGQSNLQEHYPNLLHLEKYYEDITTESSPSKALVDSLQMGRAEIYYWLWESYSAAALLASKLSLDLYLAPPSSVTNPKLPLHDVANLNQNASLILNNTLLNLSKHLELNNNSNELARFMAIQSKSLDCESLIFAPPQAIVQNDNHAFMVDPYVFGSYASCFYREAIVEYQEIFAGNNEPGSDFYRAKLRFLILLGNDPQYTDRLNAIANNNFSSTLPDSMAQGLYSDLIFDVTSLLLQKKMLSSQDAHSILRQSRFPYADLLLSLMSSNTLALGSDLQLPSWMEIVALDDPVLAPKLVENIAKYYDKQEEYSKGSLLINNFWFADASNFPPRIWWFDNYPKFMLLSYAYGRLDGGRLPLWVDNLHQISSGDKSLGELKELAKYYNVVAF
jgi:hypothetical protein